LRRFAQLCSAANLSWEKRGISWDLRFDSPISFDLPRLLPVRRWGLNVHHVVPGWRDNDGIKVRLLGLLPRLFETTIFTKPPAAQDDTGAIPRICRQC
jgi:hypothetical protein